MKNKCWLLVLVLIFGSCNLAWCDETKVTPPLWKAYELYSWKAENGDWNFSIFRADNNSLLGLSTVIDPKRTIHGVEALKKQILALPAGAKICWSPTAKGSVSGDVHGIIKYPSKEIVREILAFCKKKESEIDYIPNYKEKGK